jgi:hypothetical protein
MLRRIPPRDFELIRWPIDIFVFGLALSYGLVKFVTSLRLGPLSVLGRLSLYAIATFLCTLVVRRYLPSDRNLAHRGILATSLWINISLLLAAGVPIVGILSADSPLFWAMLFSSSTLKAVHSLESTRRKATGGTEGDSDLQPRQQGAPEDVVRRPLLDRLLFEAVPDAYPCVRSRQPSYYQ